MGKLAQEDLEYQATSGNDAILGTLRGPCADIINATRNGRRYSDDLWEKVFNNDIVKEYFTNGGIPGELDHPVDGRLDTDTSKIAIMMRQPPERNGKGQLIGTFDILNTPNGRILKCLCDYGYKIGISSRGQGEVNEGFDGDEVDPDSYDFRAFDAVLLPAVKTARLELVKESLDTSKKSLKVALQEALEKANPDEKVVMQDTIKNLKLDEEDSQPEEGEDKEVEVISEEEEEAVNGGADSVAELQEALKTIRSLNNQICSLQEKLSACYARDLKLNEELSRYKTAVASLSESAKNAKALRSKMSTLTEQLAEKEAETQSLKERIERIKSRSQQTTKTNSSLTEALNTKENQLAQVKEQLAQVERNAAKESRELKENLDEVKQNAAIKDKEYRNKLAQANNLIESYRKTAQQAVSRYVESKATAIGVKPEEVRNRLGRNYSFDDIDRICEELSAYKLRMNSLPFGVGRPARVRVTEAIEPIKPTTGFDDSVDADLMRLANLQ